jgi:hypothetical protein
MNFLMHCIRNNRVAAAAAAAAAIATAAIALYKRHKEHADQQQAQPTQIKPDPESAFENRYLKEYDKMNDDPDAPVPPSHAHVRETTPQGDVIMTYDAGRAMFCYYCDKRSVQFKYLEPLARKYVVEHGCKRLYIDIRKQAPPQAPPQATPRAIRTPMASVFARFKASVPPPFPIKDQVTRYWYCGNLNEYNLLSATDANAHDFNIIKPIDYASYKKMNNSSSF